MTLAALALVALALYVPFIPRGLGETTGEALMQRGGTVAVLFPLALLAALSASAIALSNHARLTRWWLLFGNLPLLLLLLACLALAGRAVTTRHASDPPPASYRLQWETQLAATPPERALAPSRDP